MVIIATVLMDEDVHIVILKKNKEYDFILG